MDLKLSQYTCSKCSMKFQLWESVLKHNCFEGCSKLSITTSGLVAKILMASEVQPSSPSSCQTSLSDDNVTNVSSSSTWSKSAVKLLIDLYGMMKSEFEQKNTLKKCLWTRIESRMKDHDFNFKVDQISTKWKGLLRTYKSIKNHSKGLGNNNRRAWPYFQSMDNILSKNSVANTPVTISKKRKSSNDDVDIQELLNRALEERRKQHAEDLAQKVRFNDLFEKFIEKM